MQECLLHGAATAAAQNLRTRLDVLAGHFFVLRGENRRKLELPDMSLLEYPREEGPTPCFALVFLLSNGKMNKTGKTQYMGAMRHRAPYSVRRARSLSICFGDGICLESSLLLFSVARIGTKPRCS